MATFNLYGSGNPTVSGFGDPGNVWTVGTAFKVTNVNAWRAVGARFFAPAGAALAGSGHKAYLFDSSSGSGVPPSRILATVNFPDGLVGGTWNEINFAAPVILTTGKSYVVAVYFPSGVFGVGNGSFPKTSADTPNLASLDGGNNGWYFQGDGLTVNNSVISAWYGIDVIVDDGLGGDVSASENIALTDRITVSRSGLPSQVTATGSATDSVGLVTPATAQLAVGGDTGARVLKRSYFDGMTNWGSAADQFGTLGPVLDDDLDGGSEVGFRFTLQWPVRLTGAKIYKHPQLAGSVPISVWRQSDQALLYRENFTLTSDGGGWRTFNFAQAIDLSPDDGEIIISYFQTNGKRAHSDWVFNAQDRNVPPFYVKNFLAISSGSVGGSAVSYGSHGFPSTRVAHNWYVDAIVEWDDFTPEFNGNTSDYFGQWTNATWSHAFPIGVFFADEEFLTDYASIGVNTLMATGFQMASSKIEAIKAANMDVVANIGDFDLTAVRAQAEDPTFSALLKGYFMVDEPDMNQNPFYSPATVLSWLQYVRRRDSTRPVFLNLGYVSVWNQGYWYAPASATMVQFNQNLRDYAAATDVLSCDFYSLTPGNSFGGVYGVWDYPEQIRRMEQLCEKRLPIWGYVETTSQDLNRPTPDEVRKATWSMLIAGARGIVFFDHRFAGAAVTQDFAALLHDPPMRAGIQALTTEIQSLAAALNAPDAGLVTSVASSNTISGPLGGTYGVPIHYTTRAASTTRYLFAMGIRPGATTATITIPSAAGKTITVIGEGRTLTADGGGVIVDDFAPDYTVHLYSWAA